LESSRQRRKSSTARSYIRVYKRINSNRTYKTLLFVFSIMTSEKRHARIKISFFFASHRTAKNLTHGVKAEMKIDF